MSLYKRFVQLLEKWPVDKTKPGRDLGENLREQAKIIFGKSNTLTLEDTNIEKQIAALERIESNVYAKKYPRKLNSTATGLSGEQCNQVLSSEFLDYLNNK